MSTSTPTGRSIYTAILVPMILLLLLQLLVFVGVLMGSGVLTRLDQNDRDIMSKQIESRRDSIENYLVGTVGDLDALAATINAQTQELIDQGELNLETFDTSASETDNLVRSIMDSLVSTLRTKRVSGIYVIFNSHDLSSAYANNAVGRKPGVFLRDNDPAATPSSRNEDLTLLRASSAIVQSYSITTDNSWKPMFDFASRSNDENHDFIYLPWQTAYETPGIKTASDYAFWGAAPPIADDSEASLTYTIPLILADGTVYGVLGVDLSSQYLRTLMPYAELYNNESGSYILATVDQESAAEDEQVMELHPLVVASNQQIEGAAHGQSMTMRYISTGSYDYKTESNEYFVGTKLFRLYNTNAPFEYKRWVLAGVIPESALHQFSNQVRGMIALAALGMLFLGAAGSIVAGRSISKPIQALSNDVANAQLKKMEMPHLAPTGISEVDSLTGAITSLSNDIASVRQLEQQRIEHERDFDLLTGLMNRRAFYREAAKLFASPNTLKHGALVMLDLDNLKNLNDSLGHDWGDKYIYSAARGFEEATPSEALVARISGDEFFILFYGYETREALEADIEQLRTAIPTKEILLQGGQTMPISVSGGVAFYPEDGKDFTELMKLSDFAMYQVKIAGKNSIAFFDIASYQEQSSVRRAMAELDELLSNNELSEYHFQPIFDGRTGEVFAYEALMRVSLQNLRGPEDVLTLARQEGRLAEVERLTWTRTFECFRQLLDRQEVDGSAYLFINSFASIAMDETELRALALANSNIVSKLVIEITETENVDEEATAVKRSIPGFSGQFALDDYGSGYNSEIMLLDLKPKYIKVDISIIRDIDTSIDKQRIVSHVVEYAHERDMLIIAEGVETQAELLCILDLGVDLLQGFYLARPARVPTAISEEALGTIQTHATHFLV